MVAKGNRAHADAAIKRVTLNRGPRFCTTSPNRLTFRWVGAGPATQDSNSIRSDYAAGWCKLLADIQWHSGCRLMSRSCNCGGAPLVPDAADDVLTSRKRGDWPWGGERDRRRLNIHFRNPFLRVEKKKKRAEERWLSGLVAGNLKRKWHGML